MSPWPDVGPAPWAELLRAIVAATPIPCDHPRPRPRSAFYCDDTPTSRACPACGAIMVGPRPPDQNPAPTEVRGL